MLIEKFDNINTKGLLYEPLRSLNTVKVNLESPFEVNVSVQDVGNSYEWWHAIIFYVAQD